ncbi:MAG: phenylacetic acid degradation operon negative regulatory protein PaaX [Gammaproteobacteria bacterium]|nr:phenylacetic acid degradation operon negative regulatory protein PaaX [Gammaproteobacteria bacterium]
MKKTNTNNFRRIAEELIESTVSAQPLNARALILSVFGDSVSTHGGVIWLGSLIGLVKPLGINQRLVRTSVFRLAEKELLQSRQVGRRSFYSLTDKAFRQFSHAADRIYRQEKAAWDGEWRLVFTNLDKIRNKRREALQKELNWLGFSRLSNGIYGHPTVDIEEVRQVVNEMQLQDSIVLMEAGNRNDDPLGASRKLLRHAFKFDAIDADYRDYIDCFEGFLDIALEPGHEDDELCFLVRTLLIHRFRLILLHEPELPLELLPPDSLSHRARTMTAQIYHRISDGAEHHFMAMGESEQGELPPASAEFFTRFPQT